MERCLGPESNFVSLDIWGNPDGFSGRYSGVSTTEIKIQATSRLPFFFALTQICFVSLLL